MPQQEETKSVYQIDKKGCLIDMRDHHCVIHGMKEIVISYLHGPTIFPVVTFRSYYEYGPKTGYNK